MTVRNAISILKWHRLNTLHQPELGNRIVYMDAVKHQKSTMNDYQRLCIGTERRRIVAYIKGIDINLKGVTEVRARK